MEMTHEEMIEKKKSESDKAREDLELKIE